MQQIQELGILGKLPAKEEKRIIEELYRHAQEANVRVYIPYIVVDKELVVEHLKEAKKKLGELL